ncbi:fimbria/pilus periplasmic chaperone [Pseudomonas putida]|uniref:fimbrial biogenesis chaperone n=1 Tax=Pseudomonas TaxID=286 RepID=UPI001209B230|nr:fimbria/pilus periplasmic chaperone [Pseudomonas putida]MBO0367552.1 fimbria/pilus periplasmic chaperone [Pseudomonas putida]RZI88141.1 MAG: molecular chaperone [Pseudomonas sp.]
MQSFVPARVCGLLLCACVLPSQASASVVIATTRVIYPAQQSEVTVRLSNEGSSPSLVQAWIDDGRAQAALEDLDVPFSLSPPLFRIDPKKGQSLRIAKLGQALPADRESLYWLNILDVPPKADGNVLQVSLRSRIKLLYRPVGLSGSAAEAYLQLTWKLVSDTQGWALEAYNPTPYFINLSSLDMLQGGGELHGEPSHVPPLASTRFAIPGLQPAPGASVKVSYAAIDDYGALRESVGLARP